MLEFVDVTVLHNKNTIAYISKIPELESTYYETILLKPVVRNKTIVHLENNEIFAFRDKIYCVPKNFKTLNYIKICKTQYFERIQNVNCIPK